MYNVLKLLKSYPSGLPLINVVKLLNGRKKVYRDPVKKEDKGKYTQEFNRLYIQTYRTVRADPFLFGVSKNLGLLWVTPTRGGLDLIRLGVKFQLSIKSCKNSPFTFPIRTGPERIQACKIATLIKTSSPEHTKKIESLYSTYLNNIRNRVNVLLPIPHLIKPVRYDGSMGVYDPNTGDPLIIPYSTRFNDKKISIKLLNKFDTAMQNATNKHLKAVFLTLTTDPKRHKSLWHGNRHFAPAWNKFISFLTKRLKHRPEYIASYEYNKKTKLIHAHILIFGVDWITSHRTITAEWERLNQGSVNYEYGVKNIGNNWVWKRKKPNDAHGQDAGSYLKKYIKKAVYGDNGHSLYWVFNKRFFTCSRSFQGDPAPVKGCPKYVFMGAYTTDDMPGWLWDMIYQSDNETLLQLEPG